MPDRSEGHAGTTNHLDDRAKCAAHLLRHATFTVELKVREQRIDIYEARPGFFELALKLRNMPRQRERFDRLTETDAGNEVHAV